MLLEAGGGRRPDLAGRAVEASGSCVAASGVARSREEEVATQAPATEQNREIREGQSDIFPGSKQCENMARIIEITKMSKRLNFQRICMTWVIFLKAYEL